MGVEGLLSSVTTATVVVVVVVAMFSMGVVVLFFDLSLCKVCFEIVG